MVKLSDFLNTTNTTPSVKPSEVLSQVGNALVQGAQESQKPVEASLRETLRSQAQVRQNEIQSRQQAMQSQMQLNNVFANMEQLNLNTLKQLTALDNASQALNQEAAAHSYVTAAQANLKVNSLQFLKDLENTSNPDGSEVLPKMQEWINQQHLDLEKNAPNAIAIGQLKEIQANNIGQLGSQAVDLADNMRTKYIINNNQQTVNAAANTLKTNPDDPSAHDYIGVIQSIVDKQYIPQELKTKMMENYTATLNAAKIQGYVNTLQFSKAQDFLQSDDVKSALTSEQFDHELNNILQTQDKYIKEQSKQILDLSSANAYTSGIMGDFSSGTEKEVANKIAVSTINDIFTDANTSPSDKATKLVTFFEQTKYLPTQGKDIIESQLLTGLPENRVIMAQAIMKASNDLGTSEFYDKLSSKAKATASSIAEKSQYMSPKDIVLLLDQIDKVKPNKNDEVVKQAMADLSDWGTTDVAARLNDSNWFMQYTVNSSAINEDAIKIIAIDKASEYLPLVNYDVDKAKTLAIKDLQKVYAKSTINKDTELMAAAPEAIYKNSSDMQWFEEQMQSMVKKQAEAIGGEVDWDNRQVHIKSKDGRSQDTLNFRIEPDPFVTSSQIMNGSPVTTWQMLWVAENGTKKFADYIDVNSNDLNNIRRDAKVVEKQRIDNLVKLIAESTNDMNTVASQYLQLY